MNWSTFGTVAGGLGSLAGGLSGLFGGGGDDKARRTALEMAQRGITWRVRDAQRAGIHPLYALGASPSIPASNYIGGDRTSRALSGVGQALKGVSDLATARKNQKLAEEESKARQYRDKMQGYSDAVAAYKIASDAAIEAQASRITGYVKAPTDKVYASQEDIDNYVREAWKRQGMLPPVPLVQPTRVPKRGGGTKAGPHVPNPDVGMELPEMIGGYQYGKMNVPRPKRKSRAASRRSGGHRRKQRRSRR